MGNSGVGGSENENTNLLESGALNRVATGWPQGRMATRRTMCGTIGPLWAWPPVKGFAPSHTHTHTHTALGLASCNGLGSLNTHRWMGVTRVRRKLSRGPILSSDGRLRPLLRVPSIASMPLSHDAFGHSLVPLARRAPHVLGKSPPLVPGTSSPLVPGTSPTVGESGHAPLQQLRVARLLFRRCRRHTCTRTESSCLSFERKNGTGGRWASSGPQRASSALSRAGAGCEGGEQYLREGGQ